MIMRQFLAFAGVGAVGTAAHYATLIGLVAFGFDAVTASALGCTIGAIVNYLLNYHLTFRSQSPHRRSAPRFAVVAMISLLLNTLLMAIGIKWIRLNYLVAQVFATGPVLCWNFWISRVWAFKEGGRT
jgi:putative flippase GtrA